MEIFMPEIRLKVKRKIFLREQIKRKVKQESSKAGSTEINFQTELLSVSYIHPLPHTSPSWLSFRFTFQ